ncbi:MAG: hypothetical protein HON47_04775 [Candidatus Diapherotrites archaeon]|uniref:Uncharacterized protein n=1 Tax=Candidatus Iainarchaeum sp. TaxID=3101447 RepID=A0A8T5GFS4_9ARCH|nr:hypothetical protein [Candidatus Diapherotrites archaeon]
MVGSRRTKKINSVSKKGTPSLNARTKKLAILRKEMNVDMAREVLSNYGVAKRFGEIMGLPFKVVIVEAKKIRDKKD